MPHQLATSVEGQRDLVIADAVTLLKLERMKTSINCLNLLPTANRNLQKVAVARWLHYVLFLAMKIANA